MSNFEKISRLISTSTLTSEDKDALIAIFAEISDELLTDTLAFLEKDSSSIVFLNDNRKKKVQAFTNGNAELWHSIIEEEKKYIADLTYDLD